MIKLPHHSLASRLIIIVGLTLLLGISTWAYFIIEYEKKKAIDVMAHEVDRLSSTILLGTHYAMMLNSKDDINQIIQNIGRQPEIKHLRIYNKKGEISVSNISDEVGKKTDIKAEECNSCHKTALPLKELPIKQRKRIFEVPSNNYRFMGIISPIYNEPRCSSSACHVHSENSKVLGILDVVVSLKKTDEQIMFYEKGLIFFAICIFIITSSIIGIFVIHFVNRPIKQLIKKTRLIGAGNTNSQETVTREDEIGQLARAINYMGRQIGFKQAALKEQRREYRSLFKLVPCLITVQNKNFELLRYNKEFKVKFDPKPGDCCFKAYKNRNKPCEKCPMQETFKDGKSHHSEQEGINKDGTPSFWALKTAPITNQKGKIIAVMEISVDITRRKLLEQELIKSEEKYRAIFNNIPNPVFVLDKKTFKILDCNSSVIRVYGFRKDELINKSFIDLFLPEYRQEYTQKIKEHRILTKVRQINKKGKELFVNIRVSPSEYSKKDVFLVTTSDVTKSLIAEQQLIQTSKMATLGEMGTGVAHELNQPLSVIKTVSAFFKKITQKKKAIDEKTMITMTNELDNQVDRASRIINHMREFGRKSDVTGEKIKINIAIQKAFDFFSQQLKLRDISIIRNFQEDIPYIFADANRLEQVFINFLINSRDSLEDKWAKAAKEGLDLKGQEKKIYLRTWADNDSVYIEVEDNGEGIPPEIQDKVFEPFFTTKKVGKGTGLGLSISYGIIQDYDGTIKVKQGKERGACFLIKFPVLKS